VRGASLGASAESAEGGDERAPNSRNSDYSILGQVVPKFVPSREYSHKARPVWNSVSRVELNSSGLPCDNKWRALSHTAPADKLLCKHQNPI
jgi:hypothetical protein